MRSTPSSRAGTAWPSPVARTRASMRPGRSRASRRRAAPPLREGCGGAERGAARRRRGARGGGGAGGVPRPVLGASRAPIAIAFVRARLAPRSTPGGSSGGRGPSTSPRSRRRPRSSSASTTSAPSRPTETQHEVFRRERARRRVGAVDGDRLDFTITADSFLRHMVRTLVGTMLEANADAPAGSRRLLDGATALRRRPHRSTVGPLPRARRVLRARSSLRLTPGYDRRTCASASSSSTSTAR